MRGDHAGHQTPHRPPASNEIEIVGGSVWIRRSVLTRLLKILDGFDAAGELEIELGPDKPPTEPGAA